MFKKRYLMIILLTALTLYLSNDYWFANKLVNYKLLIIIITTATLFYYKLLNYLAKFKLIENNSRIDIVFVFCIGVLMLIPASNINHDKIIKSENRTLAEYKNLFNDYRLNQSYGKNFETWYNDRFEGRKTLIRLYDITRVKLSRFHRNKKAYTGHEGWLFLVNENVIDKPFSDTQLAEYAEQISKLQDYCKQKGIKPYILISPIKEDIYREYGLKNLGDKKDRTFQLVEYLKKQQNFENIIFPYEEIIEAKKKDYVFFKTDHHWTETGALVAYKKLLSQIKKDFPEVKTLSPDDYEIYHDKRVRAEYDRVFDVGNAIKLLGLRQSYELKDDYKYYKIKNESKLKISENLLTKRDYINSDATDLKVVLVGNSFIENLNHFLPHSFKQVRKIRSNIHKLAANQELNIKRFEKEMLEIKPDILIMVFHTTYTPHLKDMF